MPLITPRTDAALTDHMAKSNEDRRALAQRQNWIIQDTTRPLGPRVLQFGIGGDGPRTAGSSLPFSPAITWNSGSPPTKGSFLMAVVCCPNVTPASAPTYGAATGWTTVYDPGTNDNAVLTRVADGTSADSNIVFTTNINTASPYAIEFMGVIAYEFDPQTVDQSSPIAHFNPQFDNSGTTNQVGGVSYTLDSTVPQLALWGLMSDEEYAGYTPYTFTVEDHTSSATWPQDGVVYHPAGAGGSLYGPYNWLGGHTSIYTLGDLVYGDYTSSHRILQVVSHLLIVQGVITSPNHSILDAVMVLGQFPNNLPTEARPYAGVPSPQWVTPARPLYGVQIINDDGTVVFQADNEHGLYIPVADHLTPVSRSAATGATNGALVLMSGAYTVTLPSAATSGQVVGVISVNGTGAAPCTVGAGATGVILGKGIPTSGAGSVLLGAYGASATFESDGTNWNIIAGEQDSGWLATSGLHSWTSSAGPASSQTVIGYRLQGDRLKIMGQLTGGTNANSAINVPAGYRPAWNQYFPVVQGGGTAGGFVLLANTGDVTPTMNVATSDGCYINIEIPLE